MKRIQNAKPEPRNCSAYRWRLGAAILLGGILFGLCGIAEAVKPVKPPPEPPPEPLSGVCYLRVDIDWGHGPDEIRRLNPDGSNMGVLFTVDPATAGYDYRTMIPSQGIHGGSRLFACVKEKLNPQTMDASANYQNIPTELVIVDEQNNEKCKVIPGDDGAYQMAVGRFTYSALYHIPDAPMAWYHNDSKLAFAGRMIQADPDAPVEPGYEIVVSDWDTMGIYTVDLVYGADGTITAGPPVLVGWTHTELVNPPDASSTIPYYIVTDFTVATDPNDMDYLYCIKLTCPADPACNDYALYRAILDDSGFAGVEFVADIYMEGLQVDPNHSVVSGNLEHRKIVYCDIGSGAVYLFDPPELRKDIVYWGAPLWSPDGANVLFGQLIRNPSLTTKSSEWVQATADLQDVTSVYKFASAERGGFIGWRADP